MTRFGDAVASELLRLRSHRVLVVLLALLPAVAIGLSVAQGVVADDDYARASAAFRQERAARYDQERANYLAMRSSMGDQLPASAHDLTVAEFESGQNFFGGRDEVVSRRYDARVHVPQTGRLLAAATALLAFVLGAVAVGRDWSSGAMAGLVLWQGRRSQSLLSRLSVLAPAVLVASLCSFGLIWVGGLADGSLRGTTQGLTAGWWTDQLWFAARSGVVGVLAVLVGGALADLARGVSVPLGTLVATLMVSPVLSGLLPAVRPWLIPSLVATTLDWGRRFRRFDGHELVSALWVSGGTALALLVLGCAVLVASAVVVRGRRNVV